MGERMEKYPSNGVLRLPEPSRVVDDGRLFYRVYGNGPPVMLIHGNRGSGYSFAPLIDVLKNRTLIIPDLPGHGYGPAMPEGFIDDPAMAVAYCYAVADDFGADKFTVVGHSLGGMIGLLMFLARRERVAGIALLDSFVDIKERPAELSKITPFDEKNEMTALQVADAFDDGPGVKWHTLFDLSGKILEFTCPVLELQGEANKNTDEIFNKWLKDKRGTIPNDWRVIRIVNSAHFMQFEQPAAVANEISRWLDKIHGK